MSCFGSCIDQPQSSRPDPTKHVNFRQGMLLGVDEFTQEFAYHEGRDEWMARDLTGCGTVCGLKVSMSPDNPEMVMVNPGHAVSPYGKMIRIPTAQCADLNDWLARNKAKVPSSLPAGELTVYVTLSYESCETDPVPIPGGPCRTEDDVTAQSRIDDSFTLALSLDPPKNGPHAGLGLRDEAGIREFVQWLAQSVKLVENPGQLLTIPEFTAKLMETWLEYFKPPISSPPIVEPVWPNPTFLPIPADQLSEYLRIAFRFWITEIRPTTRAKGVWCAENCGCDGQTESDTPDVDCMLLASLKVPVIEDDGTYYVQGEVTVDESDRPFVLHTRMLQEWLLCGGMVVERDPKVFATLLVIDDATIRAWIHYPYQVSLEAGAVEVSLSKGASNHFDQFTVNNITEVMANTFDLKIGQTLTPCSRIEVVFHTEKILNTYLSPPLPLKQLLPEVGFRYLDEFDGNIKVRIFEDNDLFFESTAGGDLSGTYPNPKVTGIWGRPISEPASNSVLRGWIVSGGKWQLSPITLDALTDVVTPNPVNGQILQYNKPSSSARGSWRAANPLKNHHELAELDHDDHPQYLKVNPLGRALIADLNAANNKIIHLPEATAAGEAMPFQQQAGKDTTGTLSQLTVIGLQGKRVSDAEPEQSDVLTWDGKFWSPQQPQSTAKQRALLPLASIRWLEKATFEVWFNIQAPLNEAEILDFSSKQLLVYSEKNSRGRARPFYLSEIPIASVKKTDFRNMYLVSLEKPTPLMRFVFLTDQMTVLMNSEEKVPLLDFTENQNLWFAGQNASQIIDEEITTVTIFVRNTAE